MNDEITSTESSRSKVIVNLVKVGEICLWLGVATGGILLILSFQCIDNCSYSFATYAFEEDPMLLVLAAACAIGGWVQKQFIHGFSVGLELLLEIRDNTAN